MAKTIEETFPELANFVFCAFYDGSGYLEAQSFAAHFARYGKAGPSVTKGILDEIQTLKSLRLNDAELCEILQEPAADFLFEYQKPIDLLDAILAFVNHKDHWLPEGVR